MKTNPDLIELLDSFDLAERQNVMRTLISEHASDLPETGTDLNMHLHSFFSYNAEGWSPSHLAWEARKEGLYSAGLCDFDVLDGLEEFLQSGLALGLRTSVNVETRAYLKEYADKEITSPGEPGVTYVMGAGFAREPKKGSPQKKGQIEYRDRARARNIALIERINPHLPDIALDYEKDVVPLTPMGTATERHIIRAYTNKARSVFEHPDAIAVFWAGIIEKDIDETSEILKDTAALEDIVRSKLAKAGGLGYELPTPETFPPIEDFMNWVASCGAVPMITWLDGTSDGESDGRALLECQQAKGGAAVNMIPDRNWNISDHEKQKLKVQKLNEIVEIADDMDLPINIGTEMNKGGLPFFDRLDGEHLKPHKKSFIRGASIMVGHTLLLRYADFSYIGEAANAEFKTKKDKNDFFESIGKLQPMTTDQARELEDMGPDNALQWFRDQKKV